VTPENLIKGIKIIQEHCERCVVIDHIYEPPMVYFEKTDTPMQKDDVITMFELGWNQGEGRSGIYNPDKGWQMEVKFPGCEEIKNKKPLA